MDTKALSELSRSTSGEITDVCLVCRERELRAVLAQVEAILSIDNQLANPKNSDSEITQEVLRALPCGHFSTCWCKSCHVCEDVLGERWEA